MSESQILAMLDHIKDVGERTEKKLDDHIIRDENITKEFIRPLWEESQQRKGAAKLAAVLYATISGVVALGVSVMMGHK